jgi:hypothetical protein
MSMNVGWMVMIGVLADWKAGGRTGVFSLVWFRSSGRRRGIQYSRIAMSKDQIRRISITSYHRKRHKSENLRSSKVATVLLARA